MPWPDVPTMQDERGALLAVCPDCTHRDGQVRNVYRGQWTSLQLAIVDRKGVDSRIVYDPCPWGPHVLTVEMLRERIVRVVTTPLKSSVPPRPLSPSTTLRDQERARRRGKPDALVIKPQ